VKHQGYLISCFLLHVAISVFVTQRINNPRPPINLMYNKNDRNSQALIYDSQREDAVYWNKLIVVLTTG
jgi:hypothetical protein